MARKQIGKTSAEGSFFSVLKKPRHALEVNELATLFQSVNKTRVDSLAAALTKYIGGNLPRAIDNRQGIADYRTNPYVLLTSAHVMRLDDPARLADFLFNNKLYMGLETSFGKSIEAAFVGAYPLARRAKPWGDSPEKVAEARSLAGLTREDRAKKRILSVWREIDKSCVVGTRRYMVSIKSGPNCINDTQVQGMTQAILEHHSQWMQETKRTYPNVTQLDIVIGITYGTEKTTNNKENQILVKLLDHGFVEEDRTHKPGVLIDKATNSIRVYRCVGQEFWGFIGNPSDPTSARFVFLEVLLALAKALEQVNGEADLEARINARIQALMLGFQNVLLKPHTFPDWVRADFTEKHLFWLTTAMTAFYDHGV